MMANYRRVWNGVGSTPPSLDAVMRPNGTVKQYAIHGPLGETVKMDPGNARALAEAILRDMDALRGCRLTVSS